MTHDFSFLLRQFNVSPHKYAVETHNQGHINDTFFIRHNISQHVDYVLQRINHAIFTDVALLMHNLETITDHIQQCVSNRGENIAHHALRLKKTINNTSYCANESGNYFRMFHAIPDAQTLNIVSTPNVARAGAFAFGQFITDLSSLPAGTIKETIPNFVNLHMRYKQLLEACKQDPLGRYSDQKNDLETVLSDLEHLLEHMEAQANLPVRVTHNDTKFNNVIFSKEWNPLCVIDLDTTMPSTVVFDFSDAVRSGAHRCPEDSPNCSLATVDNQLFKAIYDGFLEGLSPIITPIEKELMISCAHFVPLMLCARFYTDYLLGDHYFKASHKNQNLHRARVQHHLATDLSLRCNELI